MSLHCSVCVLYTYLSLTIYSTYDCGRSACESPSRAMTLVSAADLVTGHSSKYRAMVDIVRGAAEHGLQGGDCATL